MGKFIRIAALFLFIPWLLCMDFPRDRAQGQPAATTANAREAYPHTSEGIERQFDELLRSYQSGDEPGFDAAISTFSLPNPEVWLAETFGPPQGEKLTSAYAKSFAGFRSNLRDKINHYGRSAELRLAAHLSKAWDPQDTATTGTDSSTVVPLKNISIEAYNLRLSPEGRGAAGTTWMESFVYLDGAFRYLGGGASTFWSRPTSGDVLSGQKAVPIHSVQPAYPPEARAQEIEGTVRLHVLIGKDGRVSEVEVVDGPKLLRQAAVDAVKQWRYTPTLLGGQPVSVDTYVNVVFSLHH